MRPRRIHLTSQLLVNAVIVQVKSALIPLSGNPISLQEVRFIPNPDGGRWRMDQRRFAVVVTSVASPSEPARLTRHLELIHV
jgi:hypothetical protein